MSDKLEHAIHLLEVRRMNRIAKGQSTAKTCLGDVRWALAKVGLKLPSPMAKPKNTALANFNALVANPGAFGWEQVHHPLPDYTLVYFKDCGKLADGRIAGHISILHNGVIYANERHALTAWWSVRLVGGFVDKE